MYNSANILERKALVNSILTHPDPRDISLPDVHNVLGIVDQMVDLPFKDRLKVKLHLTAGHLDIDTQWQGATLLDILHILTNNLHLAIIDFIHLGHLAQLSALGLATAHFEEKIVLSDPLTFKCRTIG